MSQAERDPTCSFCGATLPSELVRAGGRDFWICSACVERPPVGDIFGSDVICTFCEKQARQMNRSGTFREREVAAAHRGVVLCTECIQVCRQIISEDRAIRAASTRDDADTNGRPTRRAADSGGRTKVSAAEADAQRWADEIQIRENQ
jgi:hypothetical protein